MTDFLEENKWVKKDPDYYHNKKIRFLLHMILKKFNIFFFFFRLVINELMLHIVLYNMTSFMQ